MNSIRSLMAMVCFLPVMAFSQERETDSLMYYRGQINRLQKQYLDSLRASEDYQQAMAGIERHKVNSKNYTSFVLFSGIMNSNLDKLNQGLSANGFDPIKSNGVRYGLGWSIKSGRSIFDFYFMSGASFPASKKDGAKIKSELINIFQFDLGVNVLPYTKVNLYPFVGVAVRAASLDYDTTVVFNPDFNSIVNLVQYDRSVNVNSLRIGYQAGLGLDLVFAENRKKTTSKIFFIKAGINRPFWKDRYSYKGVKFDPGIRHGIWVIDLGIKFAGKN